MTHFTSLADVNAYVKDMEKNSVINNHDINVMRWESPLDNHQPAARNYGAGYLVKYANRYHDEAYVLFHDEQFGDNRKLAFTIDGKVFYNASWNESGGFFILHPYPNSVDMGPRKLYQVRVKPLVSDNDRVMADMES